MVKIKMDHWNKNDRIIETNTYLNVTQNRIGWELINQTTPILARQVQVGILRRTNRLQKLINVESLLIQLI